MTETKMQSFFETRSRVVADCTKKEQLTGPIALTLLKSSLRVIIK